MIAMDTSVLVASLVESHRFHTRSLKVFQEFTGGRTKGLVCAHSLAELYSVLTNYPSQPRISPQAAESLVAENLFSSFKIISLNPQDYRKAIRRMRDRELKGGVIYDALILQAALKKKAKILYTWNSSDFSRLVDHEIEIREP